MSKDNNERKVRKARALFKEWLKDDTSIGFEEKYGWEAASVIYRRIRHSPNSRKIAAYMKIHDRRRARRELEREVLDPFIYTRRDSMEEYDHAGRYEGETYGAQWADWDWSTYGSNCWEDDAFDEEVERWVDEVSRYDDDVLWGEIDDYVYMDSAHSNDSLVPFWEAVRLWSGSVVA